ncbi:hypothetical protein J6590_045266 [Homalodisca vitripennis]|nr:hypothetical protein J6590_045266 [Homalodisca vitripennis]
MFLNDSINDCILNANVFPHARHLCHSIVGVRCRARTHHSFPTTLAESTKVPRGPVTGKQVCPPGSTGWPAIFVDCPLTPSLSHTSPGPPSSYYSAPRVSTTTPCKLTVDKIVTDDIQCGGMCCLYCRYCDSNRDIDISTKDDTDTNQGTSLDRVWLCRPANTVCEQSNCRALYYTVYTGEECSVLGLVLASTYLPPSLLRAYYRSQAQITTNRCASALPRLPHRTPSASDLATQKGIKCHLRTFALRE